MTKRTGIGCFLAAAGVAGAAAFTLGRLRPWTFDVPAMGTEARITVVGSAFERLTGKLRRIVNESRAELEEVEKLMSIYRGDSDISRLNREGEGALDVRTFEVIEEALEVSRLTDGAFNIFMLPIERAWGFKSVGARGVPQAGGGSLRVASAAAIRLTREGGRPYARILEEGARMDLGGIAKGYAADRVAALLREAGLRGALIDIGGDCYCLGKNAAGSPWRMGIRHPRRPAIIATIELEDRAVATSGDYEDFFIEAGVRYSHIFDPKTSRPASSGLISATVIADSCAMADALATALIVMGREKALRLVERLPGTECILVNEGKEGLVVSRSSGLGE